MISEKNPPEHTLDSEKFDQKNTIFATINEKDICGIDILRVRNRILIENESTDSFVYKENSDNTHFLNTESLQKLIEVQALVNMSREQNCMASENEVSEAIFGARSDFENEDAWEASLMELSLDSHSIREHFFYDISINKLLDKHFEELTDADEETIKSFYDNNLDSMKTRSIYTFIEIEVTSKESIREMIEILSGSDVTKIAQKSQELSMPFKLNEMLPEGELPEPLQEVCRDLEIGKIGTLPLEEGSFVLIKILQKTPEKLLSLEEATPGLQEYIKLSKHKEIMDSLVDVAIQNSNISYQNLSLLKELN